MLERAVNMFAFAGMLDDGVTPPQSSGIARSQRDFAVPRSCVAQSTFSLAMIREAFKGLLVTSERSYSSRAEQRGVLELSIEQGRPLDGNSTASRVEAFSFDSILDVEHNAAITTTATFMPPVSPNGFVTQRFTSDVSSR